MPAIDEDKDADKVLPFAQIVFDHLFPLLPLALGHLCETIAGKIDDVPAFVDIEMIDELRLAGGSRSLGELCIVGDHIDHRRFAHIATSYEGIFRPIRRRAFCIVRTADHVDGGMDLHK